jgi:hypothetical protein
MSLLDFAFGGISLQFEGDESFIYLFIHFL